MQTAENPQPTQAQPTTGLPIVGGLVSNIDTPQALALIVLGALGVLIALRRGVGPAS